MSKKKQDPSAAGYEVGRGKPPKGHRFKPGQSGNPGGRKKGSLNLKTVFDQVASKEIEISEGGRKRSVTALDGVALRLLQEALAGRLGAISLFLEQYARSVGQMDDRIEETSEEDNALLDRLFGSRLQGGLPIEAPLPAPDDEEGTDNE